VSERWEFSDNFIHDIANNSVKAIVNSDDVKLREDHIIIYNNVFKGVSLYEELQVLQRSNFKESIGNTSAYWYTVPVDDGSEGWVYGTSLIFFPIFPFQ
jgi:hypothetical protein